MVSLYSITTRTVLAILFLDVPGRTEATGAMSVSHKALSGETDAANPKPVPPKEFKSASSNNQSAVQNRESVVG
jgi:hypothetical protein